MNAQLGRCFALAVLGTLCAGCLGSSHRTKTIAWISERPATFEPSVLAPPCTASDLRVGHYLQGATGSLVGGIAFRVVGPGPCSLLGRPRVRFQGGAARQIRLRVDPARDVLSPEDTRPASVLRSLRRGDKVISEIFWRNWCSARGYESPPGPTVLAVSLPRGGGSLRLGLTGDSPRCDLPGRPSYLGVGPFVAPIPEPLPSSHLPLAVEIIGAPAGKEPKAVARRGTAFHYRLALRNTSRRPFRFESCPTYEELWVDGSLGPKETFVLNCRPVGTLRPQEHAVFEMVLDVPREARLGPHGFTWMLAPETYEPPWAPGSVLVTR